MLSACDRQQTAIDSIYESGRLSFVTVKGPLTYFTDTDGSDTGPEYELASRFADYLGVELDLIVVDHEYQVASFIVAGKALLGSSAAALADYPGNKLRYGPAYTTARRQLIHHRRHKPIKSLMGVKQDEILINREQSLQALAQALSIYYPHIVWRRPENISIAQVFGSVSEDSGLLAVTDSNRFNAYRHLFPKIKAGIYISDALPVAWMYRRDGNDSLDQAVRRFFKHIDENGFLARLLAYYYSKKELNYLDTRAFLRSIDNKLPAFKDLFKSAAGKNNIDWPLLAALSYQESHWNAGARSPTGVRGLMMLTINTARSLGVKNRLNAEQSINGGARYLRQIWERIPTRINDYDRLRFALTAYNIGPSHLEDARRLAQSQGMDPDDWDAVSEYLPLLEEQEWYEKTIHGYARGAVASVGYVHNILRYYDILKWRNANLGRTVPAQGRI